MDETIRRSTFDLPRSREWSRKSMFSELTNLEDVVNDITKIVLSAKLNLLARAYAEMSRMKGFQTGWDNFAEKCMLVITELTEIAEADPSLELRLMPIVNSLSRAVEADRYGNKDNVAEEIADTLIRIFNLVGACGIDIEEALVQKTLKNAGREFKHGKNY